MSDIFLNGELQGVCSPELAETVGLCVNQYEKRIAELEQQLETMRTDRDEWKQASALWREDCNRYREKWIKESPDMELRALAQAVVDYTYPDIPKNKIDALAKRLEGKE